MPSFFAMVTAVESPLALNEPVGFPTLILNPDVGTTYLGSQFGRPQKRRPPLAERHRFAGRGGENGAVAPHVGRRVQ